MKNDSQIYDYQPAVLNILQCLRCRKGAIAYVGRSFLCDNCGKEYTILNGIPELLPENRIRQPNIYDDPNFKEWEKDVAHSYYYEKNRLIAFVQKAGHKAAQKMRRDRSYKTILDLGCGDGAHIEYVDDRSGYLGVDIDRNVLKKLKVKHPDIFIVLADCYDLPMRDKSVDCVLNIYNLEHMCYLDITLEEMRRILSDDGDIYISVPNVGGVLWNTGSRLFTQRQLTTHRMNFKRVIEISHINCIWQLEKALKRYFKITRKTFFPFGVPNSHINLITSYLCVKR